MQIRSLSHLIDQHTSVRFETPFDFGWNIQVIQVCSHTELWILRQIFKKNDKK